MRRLSRSTTFGALCCGVALVSACGTAVDTSAAAVKANVPFANATAAATGDLTSATWLMSKEPATLDTDNTAAGQQTDLILSNVCERLIAVQPDLTTKPGLAEKFDWTTPTTLVFTVRKGVKFHSGHELTADDVLWSLQRHAKDGANESDEYVNVAGMKKTGPYEVTLTMTQPDAVFIKALAGDAGVIFEKAAVESQGKAFGTPGGTDACTGPLQLKKWDSGRAITISRFDGYWNASHRSKVGELTFHWAADDALVNSLITGEADGAYLEDPATATRLASGADTTVTQGPDSRVWDLMVSERGALADPRLRQALSLALDRDGISRAALAGLGQPAKEPIGPGAWGYEAKTFQAANDKITSAPAKPSEANIAAAKKLVQEVGTTKPIVVASDGDSVRNVIANAVVDAAGKIGLTASIIQVPTAQYGEYYSDAKARGQADLWSDDYSISKADPVGFYKNGASTTTVEWVFKDPGYDALVKKARAELDDPKRAQLSIQLAGEWEKAMPWIPVVQSPTTVAMSKKVTGVPASGCNRFYPWAADLGTKGA